MLLREMTSSAFAPSFKRFARCAVAGLALAGLAACGGGGSSTPAATAPTTPTPDPTPSTPPEIPVTPASAARACIHPPGAGGGITCSEFSSNANAVESCSRSSGSELVQQCPRSGSEYRVITECRFSGGASLFTYNDLRPYLPERVCSDSGESFRILKPTSPITYAFIATNLLEDGRWAWASRFGTSASEAESNARTACGNLLGISSCSVPVPSVETEAHIGCWAFATSIVGGVVGVVGDIVAVGEGRTRQQAETDALSTCATNKARKSCRIHPGESGNPGVICGTLGR